MLPIAAVYASLLSRGPCFEGFPHGFHHFGDAGFCKCHEVVPTGLGTCDTESIVDVVADT